MKKIFPKIGQTVHNMGSGCYVKKLLQNGFIIDCYGQEFFCYQWHLSGWENNYLTLKMRELRLCVGRNGFGWRMGCWIGGNGHGGNVGSVDG